MPDAIVAGAGPAGMSAAIALRRRGADVAVLEQHATPPPRVCGAFIDPEGVAHLEDLGVLEALVDRGAVEVRDCRVTWPRGGCATVAVVRGGRAGLAVRRQTLEQALVQRLEGLGGAVRWRTRVTRAGRCGDTWRVECESGRSRLEEIAPLMILADGRFSTMAVGDRARTLRGWFGWNAPFVGVGQRPGSLSLHFGRRGYVGLLTFGDGVTNVCGLTWSDRALARSWDEVLADSVGVRPALAGLLRGATKVGAFRGVGPLPFAGAMRDGRGALLAGDAAAVGDPYLGEGISRALGTGAILADALASRGPASLEEAAARYDRAWRRQYHPRLRMGRAARWLLDRPRLAGLVVGQVASRPVLLEAVLSVAHGRRVRP